jgi:hypothetical protein
MPVLFLDSPPLSKEDRQTLAALLTTTAANLASVPPEKVQIFFRDAATILLDVHAVYPEAQPSEWADAFHRALYDFTDSSLRPDIRIHTYPPDRTARAGALRSP